MSDDAKMHTLLGHAQRVLELKGVKDGLEEQLSDVNKELEVLTRNTIPELMSELELKTATFKGVGRLQLAADIFMSTKEGQKEKAIQWFRDCGYDGIIQEGYNASTAKAIFRGLLKEGATIPEDIFNITPFTRASLVKA